MRINMHGNMPDVNTRTVGVSLPLELVARIDRAARERCVTRSDVIRVALDAAVGGSVSLNDEDLVWVARTRRDNILKRERRRKAAERKGR